MILIIFYSKEKTERGLSPQAWLFIACGNSKIQTYVFDPPLLFDSVLIEFGAETLRMLLARSVVWACFTRANRHSTETLNLRLNNFGQRITKTYTISEINRRIACPSNNVFFSFYLSPFFFFLIIFYINYTLSCGLVCGSRATTSRTFNQFLLLSTFKIIMRVYFRMCVQVRVHVCRTLIRYDEKF